MTTFLILIAFVACSSAASSQQKPTLEDLAWMAGCWERSSAARVVEEQWMRPSGGTMLGMSRTVVNGKTVEYEHLIIKHDGETIDYIATPSGQQQATFRLVKFSATEAVFENPEHDFPQRIIYRIKEDGSLHARIEGKMNGRARGIDFPFNKVSCDKK